MSAITLGNTPPSEEVEEIFTLDGVTYTGRKEIPGSWTLQCLEVEASQGATAAALWAARKVLGPEALKALTTSDSVTQADIRQVFEIVRLKVTGPMEDEGKG